MSAKILIEPLSERLTYGVQVNGLTMDQVREPENRKALKDAFIQHGVIVFRDADVTNDLHVAVSEIFGPTAEHSMRANMAVEGHDELIRIKYDPVAETVHEVDGQLLGGYIPWHFDAVFTPRINRGGVLRMETEPSAGGATGFIDRIDIYQTLPQRLRDRIEGLEVVYEIQHDYTYCPRSKIRIVKEGDIYRKARLDRAAGKFPPVAHKLVYRQIETGRPVLNISMWPPQYVLGLEPKESHDLLMELAYYATDESRAYFHEWKGLRELVAWDNWRMLHKACGVAPDDHRSVIRTTIAGDYGHGRALEEVRPPEERARIDIAVAQ